MFSSLFRTPGPGSSARILIISAIIFIAFITSLPVSTAFAQQHLFRISSVERSDGLGYVMRFHMDEPADSFKVRQPFVDLIQLKIYKSGVDPELIRVFETERPYRGMEIKQIPGGIGIDVHLNDNEFFKAVAYPDVNNKDLLLALTQSDERELRLITDGIQPISWSEFVPVGMKNTVIGDMVDYNDEDIDDALDLYDDFGDFTSESLEFKVVVIDAGHGGKDPGAIGHKGTKEKDITLAVALKLGNYINEYLPDIEVVYTRDDDSFVELDERGRLANRAQGDLFISLHGNSHSNQQPTGAEVYMLGLTHSKEALEITKKENSVIQLEDNDVPSEEITREQLVIYELANTGNLASSELFAGLTERQFAERARRRSRGVKQGPFMVLYHASMPAVLVELGFISNPKEQNYLTSDYGQSIMASAIFRAVRDYKTTIERSLNNSSQP